MIQKLSRPGEEGIPERRTGTRGRGCWSTSDRGPGMGPGSVRSVARLRCLVRSVGRRFWGSVSAWTRQGVGRSREPLGTSTRPGGRGVQFVLLNFTPLCAPHPALCPILFSSICRKWKREGGSGLRGGNRQWTLMNANGNLTAEARAGVFSSFCRISLRPVLRALPSAPNLFSSICRKWKREGGSGLKGGNRQWTLMNANGGLISVRFAKIHSALCPLPSALCPLLPAPCSLPCAAGRLHPHLNPWAPCA